MKVSNITLIGYWNYGNRLQNYAVNEKINKLGYTCETSVLDYSKKKYLINRSAKKTIKIFFSRIKKSVIKEKRNLRTDIFKSFVDHNIEEKKYQYSENFDYYIVGSDQVWNPDALRNSTQHLLSFVPKEKRISLSASFGVSEIPDNMKEMYSKYLSEMKAISVREEAGVKIVKELTGRDATLLVDPTMLLTKYEWIEVENKEMVLPKKYLLLYYLGEQTGDVKETIDTLCKERDLEVVNMYDKVKHPEYYNSGPAEFITMIHNCEIFLTDSFHGCVFAILFDKPFYAFERKDHHVSMSSRIDTLLSTFELPERRYESGMDLSNAFNIDYSHVEEILEIERKKAHDFLVEALEIKE